MPQYIEFKRIRGRDGGKGYMTRATQKEEASEAAGISAGGLVNSLSHRVVAVSGS
jgi:hypothetical protein